MSLAEFPFRHTPGANWDYTIPLSLNVGASIVSASVAVVDESGAAILAPDLTLSSVSFGVISGTKYGITFWATGGSAQPYLICATFALSGSPVATGKRTVRLVCAAQV